MNLNQSGSSRQHLQQQLESSQKNLLQKLEKKKKKVENDAYGIQKGVGERNQLIKELEKLGVKVEQGTNTKKLRQALIDAKKKEKRQTKKDDISSSTGDTVVSPPTTIPPTTPDFKCKSNQNCWDHHKSNQYYCNMKKGECIKCAPGYHGKKDGSPECCKDKPEAKKKPESEQKKEPKQEPKKEFVKWCGGHTYCDKVGIGRNRTLDLNKDSICDTCGGKIPLGSLVINWPDSSREVCPGY